MPIPEDADKLAAGFHKLEGPRKKALLNVLRGTAPERLDATVAEMIGGGGDDGAFVQHIFGKELPSPKDARENKKLGPTQTK